MEITIDFPGGARVDAHFGAFTVPADVLQDCGLGNPDGDFHGFGTDAFPRKLPQGVPLSVDCSPWPSAGSKQWFRELLWSAPQVAGPEPP